MTLVQAIITEYNGILFRSRLEARWAVFFDSLQIQYKYEPEWDEVDIGVGYIYYKPDFYLPGIDLWVEVKPVGPERMKYGDQKKIEGWAKDYGGLLVLVGTPSLPGEDTEAHYHLTWDERRNRFTLTDQVWWCECPRCGLIDIRPGGSIPDLCEITCYPEDKCDRDIEDQVIIPDGHKSPRIVAAYRAAQGAFKRKPKKKILEPTLW